MKSLFFVIFGITSSILSAHPGIGLVYDGDQTIYYTDLEHVWALNTETGQIEIAIENVHTHELCMDSLGNIYGEHYWYDEPNAIFKNYIWRFTPDEKFEIIREEKEGENQDFSFVRDEKFTARLVNLPATNTSWSFYLQDLGLAYLQYPGVFIQREEKNDTLIYPISDWRFPFSIQNDHHKIFGVWANNEDYFIALYGGRKVLNINPKKHTTSIYTSSFFWSPINGVFDEKNQLWIMEWSLFGQARVRKIEPDPHASFLLENIFFAITLIAIALPIFFVSKRSKKKLTRTN